MEITSELRWLLLLIAIVAVGGIYFFHQWNTRRRSASKQHHSATSIDIAGISTDIDSEVGAVSVRPERENSPKDKERIIIFYITAAEGKFFHGQDILHVSAREGLTRSGGEKAGFFEYMEVVEKNKFGTLFYMTNMFNPGTFQWESMSQLKTSGLSIFARLPSVLLPLDVLNKAYRCAKNIASELQGTVLDEKQEMFTDKTYFRLEEELREYYLERAEVGEEN